MIKDNVAKVRADIAVACRAAGRDPSQVILVAVTKSVPVHVIAQAVSAGIEHIAENQVQEAEKKFPDLIAKDPHLTGHIIGHLQTNKAGDALKVAGLIQSVDSARLADEIEKQAAKLGRTADILVQVNTAREPQKHGAAPEKVFALMEHISGLKHVRVLGLMAMAPLTEDEGRVRKAFSDLRDIRDGVSKRFSGNSKVNMKYLSMGMSSDYRIAIQEGSTMVRIGSAIFK
ncbi:MAG: YggS family pyridoxal phosphate-dependent enzyme [Candidatus Omnitrophota bacterium]|nr:YggS family pyridoxal phosphate-dependent enzyme [Candidatus Omnitrophota bacterium]